MSKAEQGDELAEAGPDPAWIPLVVMLELGVIVALAAVIYNALFPKAFWQSRELEKSLAKWNSQHITHYRMSLLLPGSSHNEGRLPLTVEVKNGQVVSVVDALGQVVSPESDADFQSYYPYAFTVEGLFSYAYETIWGKPPSVVITYDPGLGYPRSILIDPWVEPCCQWFGFAIQDMRALSP